MKDIAPNIFRQRLLVEGFYNIDIYTKKDVKKFFDHICTSLKLKTYGDPIIFSPGGEGKEINQGFDAFVPLIDSGISAYIWSNVKFFSVILYTCKQFDESKAIDSIKEFFKAKDVESMSF